MTKNEFNTNQDGRNTSISKDFMPNMMSLFGILFIFLGIGSYVLTGYQSITALIPAFFGILLIVAFLISKKNLGFAGHLAAGIALLGFLGSARSFASVPALLTGQPLARPSAVAVQAIFALLCLVFIGLCIKWFLNARKARI